MDDLLKVKTQIEPTKLQMMELKMGVNEKKQKADLARMILVTDGICDLVWDKANETLLHLLL